MIHYMKKIFLSALLMIMPMMQLGAKVDYHHYEPAIYKMGGSA